MNLLTILLQAGGQQQSPYFFYIMMGLIFVVFYFFMIRPQMKRQKEIKQFREAIKEGDRVITSGGIIGKVKEVKESDFVLEIAENVRIKVNKGFVFASPEDAQPTK
jgi:preprotein translocase subunit YajC